MCIYHAKCSWHLFGYPGKGCKGVYGCAGAGHTHTPVVCHQSKWRLATPAWRPLCKSFLQSAVQSQPRCCVGALPLHLCLPLCMHPLCMDLQCMYPLSLYIVCLQDCLASLLLLTGWLACCFLVCLLDHLIIPAPVTDTKRTITSQLRLVHLPTIKVTMTALSALVICHAGHSCG